MKNFDVAFKIILFFSVSIPLFGAHDFLLNGSTETTLSYGDSLTLSLYPESPGAEVRVKIVIDANSDGTAESDEPIMSRLLLKDGSPFDHDETVNGHIVSLMEISDLGYLSGDFVLIAMDNAVSDSAILHLLPISTSLTVSGTVIVPSDRPGITVFVARETEDSSAAIAFRDFFGDLTDENGNFMVTLPEEFYGDTFFLFPIDIAGVLPNYVSPELMRDTLVLTGPISGLSVSFTPTDNTVIAGDIKDNYGNTLPDTSRVLFIGAAFSLFDTSAFLASTWSSSGNYSRHLKSYWGSFWEVFLDVSSMYPHYMTPPPSPVLILGSDSVGVDLTAYIADDRVRGHVYLNGTPADEIRLLAEGYLDNDTIGSTFTASYSDGHYKLFVSSQADSYRICVDTLSLPPYSSVSPDYAIALPGDSGINFYITAPVPGDANSDGSVNPVDLVFLANYLYGGGNPPDPLWLGDENCDGAIDNADLMYLGNYLYGGGPEPVPCFPEEIERTCRFNALKLQLIALRNVYLLKSRRAQ